MLTASEIRRIKRQARRSEMTPEELDAERIKSRDRNRKWRQNMTPEERRAQNEKARAQLIERIARMTPEEFEAYKEKEREKCRKHRKKFAEQAPPEEILKHKEAQKIRGQRWYQKQKQPERIEEHRRKNAEAQRRHLAGKRQAARLATSLTK